MSYTVTLIKGDGIGPEISLAVQHIFSAANVPVTWEEADAGLYCIEKYGNGIPSETLESIARNKIALKAPTTTPIGGGHKSINVTIRKTLDLFANVRPAKSLPGIATRFDNVDIIIVRENIEDTYGGIEHQQSPELAQCLRLISRPGSRAISSYAFQMAEIEKRSKVTCVHKANIMKMTDGLFLSCFQDIAKAYPGMPANDILIDNLCMQLVTRPEQFDVLVLPNLFGDIVSDLCAGLVGGLGVAPGGNIGRDAAVFEAVHGSAPDIAGKGLANPTAFLLSGLQMLRYMGLVDDAARVENALFDALRAGQKTKDLGGTCSTMEFADQIIARLAPRPSDAPTTGTASTISVPVEARVDQQEEWELHGVDVFVRSNDFPDLPKELGALKLQIVSNRGTKVWPDTPPNILMIDCFRARYYSDTPIMDSDVTFLLAAMPFPWMHVEKLYVAGGEALFTKAQGQ